MLKQQPRAPPAPPAPPASSSTALRTASSPPQRRPSYRVDDVLRLDATTSAQAPEGAAAPALPQAAAEEAARDLLTRVVCALAPIAVIVLVLSIRLPPAFAAGRFSIVALLLLLSAAGLTPLARARAGAYAEVSMALFALSACFVVATVYNATNSTFVAIIVLSVSLQVVRPASAASAALQALAFLASWALTSSGCFAGAPTAAFGATAVEGVAVGAAAALCAATWLLSSREERAALAAQHALAAAWQATLRLLTAALPPQVLPALVGHYSATGSWSGAPATADLHVAIAFVRFPPLSHAAYPPGAPAAVARLNDLCACVDRHFSAAGLTTLEVTDTEVVGVAGLEGSGGDAALAVRACLAVRRALPGDFGALAVAGVHAGPVMAGFVGELRPRYTLVGDTINTAARMASAAREGGLTVSAEAWELAGAGVGEAGRRPRASLRTVSVKGKGQMQVYDVEAGGGAGEEDAAPAAPAQPAAPAAAPAAPAQPAPPPAAAAADSLTRFTPRALGWCGFAEAQAEARYQARPVSRGAALLGHALFSFVVGFVLFSGPLPAPKFARMVVNAVALAGQLAALAATAALPPGQPLLRLLHPFSYFGCLLVTSLLAEMLSIATLGACLAMLIPARVLPALTTVGLSFALCLLVSLLSAAAWYLPELPRPAPWPGPAHGPDSNGPLVFMWVVWVTSSIGALLHDRSARGRWAAEEALAAAQGAGAGVLGALLPAALLERLRRAGGSSGTAALTRVNPATALLVADIVEFTAFSAAAPGPAHVFTQLNAAFTLFDRAAAEEGAFKVKTVGDCMVLAAGLRDFPCPAGASLGARVALLQRVAAKLHRAAEGLGLRLRAAVHVGGVVSGALTVRGFVLDVWGEAVGAAVAAAAAAAPGSTAVTPEAAAAAAAVAVATAAVEAEAAAEAEATARAAAAGEAV